MSFVTPIQGYIPNSEFIYTTTNVNADFITCSDLTATNATFTNLITTTFSPVNIVGTNLTCDNATINSADINSATIDEIKLNDISGSGDTSIIYRDANQVNFIGKADPTESGVDYLFYHNQKSGPPRFKILRDTNSCECQNMSITSKLTTEAIDVGIIKIEDGTLFDRSSYLELVNGLFKFIGDLNTPTNISFYCKLSDGPKLTVNNLGIQTPGLVDAATLKADISQNLTAGAGITLSTLNGVTQITNSAQVEDPLTINTLNSTTINNSGTITTNNLNSSTIIGTTITGNIGGNLSAGTGITLSTLNGITQITNSAQVEDPLTINTLNSTTINNSGTITTDKLVGDIGDNLIGGTGIFISTVDGLTTITNTAQVEDPLTINTLNSTTINNSGTITTNNLNSSTITGTTITGNIGGNLMAGEGIDLLTLGGQTVISNTGGLATSTQYAFQATSNSGGNVLYSAGGVVNFNQIVLCIPSTSNYNTTNKNYVVQVQGYYQFGFKLYLNSSTTTVARFGIYKNGSLLGMGGAYLANAETITVIALCNPGDLINVKCEVGTNISIYMAPLHSWFYGFLLQPKNNTIDTTTNLLLNELNVTTNIISPAATITTLNTTNLNSATITSTDLIEAATINMSLITGGGIILTNSIFSPIVKGDQLIIRSSDPITYGDASINKFNNTVNFNAGDGVVSGIFKFSTNAINYNMVYDGNLNISTEANITTGNITTLNSDSITADVNVTSPAATITSLNSTNITSDNATIGSLTTSIFNYTPNFFYASYASTIPLSGTIFTFGPGTITTNSGYTFSNGVTTVSDSSYYRITAQINYQNNATTRACGELAAAINGTEQLSYPKGYSYARGANEGRFASSVIADWIVFLNSGQNVRFYFSVALGTSTTFNGTLVGINSLPGGYISITKIS